MNSIFKIYIYNKNSLTEDVKNKLSNYFSESFSEEDDLYITITYLDDWTIQFSIVPLTDEKNLEILILEKLVFNDNDSKNPLKDYKYGVDETKKNTIPESLFDETKNYVNKLWSRFLEMARGLFDKK